MERAVERGINEDVRSHSGLTGGDAVLIQKYRKSGKALSGDMLLDAVSKAVATNEVNAAMGTICATPTAGSAGVVPGVLFGLREKLKPTREEMVRFLFTSGAFGFVVANNASISGAAGGCQAEVGSATGMAAAAVVELAGGSPSQSAHAMAIALKNMLGLICDPVAGLVEVPCVKRNAMGAANAIVAADMALAGVESRIPCGDTHRTKAC
jgi:L-serine dehydratase